MTEKTAKKPVEKVEAEVRETVAEMKKKVEAPVAEIVDRVEEFVDDVEEKLPAVFEDFLRHQRKALEETGAAFSALLPQEVRTHTSNAYKEAVEGYRTLFNNVVDEILANIEKIKIRVEERKN